MTDGAVSRVLVSAGLVGATCVCWKHGMFWTCVGLNHGRGSEVEVSKAEPHQALVGEGRLSPGQTSLHSSVPSKTLVVMGNGGAGQGLGGQLRSGGHAVDGRDKAGTAWRDRGECRRRGIRDSTVAMRLLGV